MKTSSNLIIWVAIVMIFVTTISNYHGYTTTLVVNEKLQEVELKKQIKYLLWSAFFSMVFIKNIQKKPNA